MGKKYTAREVKEILSDVLCGAFEHMEGIVQEIKKMGPEEEFRDDAIKSSRAKVLTLTMICINDIIHPAHDIAYHLFNDRDDILDLYARNHDVAIKNKIVPNCFCMICRKKKRPDVAASQPASEPVTP